VNKTGMDFDEANDTPATETFELDSEQVSKTAKPLMVKMTK
jgi:hypothetical protein